MSHLNIESSYVFCKNIYIFPSSCLTSGLAVYFCKLTGCLMSDSLTLRSDSSQAGARWAVYSVIHSLVTPPAPLCISLYFCITARCEVCEVYFRSLILIWRMHRGADEILQKEFHAAFQSRASECKAVFLIVFIFFRYLPMMGRKVNLFWPITLVEKSVAYNNILQTGFKLVLTVRILQTLGFQPCYVFILDSLQAQWITVYGPRILNKMLHPNLQILPVEINTNVYVVCVQSNWVLSLYVMNISSITLSQISFYCIFCPLSLDWVQRYKNAKDAISCRRPNPCSLPAWDGDYWFITS